MGKLTLVPTPVGNLEDITHRALRFLNEANLILAEDTRQTLKLLRHFKIEKPLYAYHQHNEHKTTAGWIKRLQSGDSIALVSDAGTPGISDPGFLLVRACVENNIEVSCLPGATAFVPALAASGLPCDKFFFEGFLPQKKGRQTRLKELAEMPVTIVLYESPHRLLKCLEQLLEFFGSERRVVVAREISKLHETFHRGTVGDLLAYFQQNEPRGEIVIIVEAKNTKNE
ncbi:MAG: 16S rRNA (cytidine(1402)-2'-O)-methyltransferase [Flavobacteriales bacterium]